MAAGRETKPNASQCTAFSDTSPAPTTAARVRRRGGNRDRRGSDGAAYARGQVYRVQERPAARAPLSHAGPAGRGRAGVPGVPRATVRGPVPGERGGGVSR